MTSLNPDNRVNPRVECVSSSKYPPCSSIHTNLLFNGYACNFATASEAIPKGAVLRPSTTVDRQVVQTTGADDILVLGVAAEASPAGERVCMAVGGEFQVLVTGAVTRGDLLSSSGTIGVVTNPGAIPGNFAIAMNSDANAGTKLVWVRFKKAETF